MAALIILTALIFPVYKDIHCLATEMPLVPFIIPLNGDIVTLFRDQYFDMEKSVERRHTGIDIAGQKGQEVVSAGNGTVSYIGISPIGGRTLVIRHNERIRTTYLNLEKIYVSEGQSVFQGQKVATIGVLDDPSSDTFHLHFAVILGDIYLDPMDVLGIDYSEISRFIEIRHVEDDFFVTAR